jgi:hypothetical protein
MPCCGGQRQGTILRPVADDTLRHAPAPISFVYIGETTLRVIGGATGRTYHFNYPGCRLEVHARDAPGLVSIPMLRRVT